MVSSWFVVQMYFGDCRFVLNQWYFLSRGDSSLKVDVASSGKYPLRDIALFIVFRVLCNVLCSIGFLQF